MNEEILDREFSNLKKELKKINNDFEKIHECMKNLHKLISEINLESDYLYSFAEELEYDQNEEIKLAIESFKEKLLQYL